jgi:hypothetical protein
MKVPSKLTFTPVSFNFIRTPKIAFQPFEKRESAGQVPMAKFRDYASGGQLLWFALELAEFEASLRLRVVTFSVAEISLIKFPP